MTTFINGPAQGHHLMLHLSPLYLRVCEESAGKWDALDAPGDSPKPTEKLYAYELVEVKGTAHINAGRGRSGFYPIADYRYCVTQPGDHIMRDAKLWEQWQHANKPK